jgi:signal transduction histidine kinase
MSTIPNKLVQFWQNDSIVEDAVSVLRVIQKRSQGLARFAESYNSLLQLTSPERKLFRVTGLFDEVKLHFLESIKERAIAWSTSVLPDTLELNADEQLVSQVLVNLIRNAIRAMEKTLKPRMELKAYMEGSKVIIEVVDNGEGIPEDIIGSVFVPFFTTRENGSGIGLSLSKQIMTAHNGSIDAISKPGEWTMFRLVFYQIL